MATFRAVLTGFMSWTIKHNGFVLHAREKQQAFNGIKGIIHMF